MMGSEPTTFRLQGGQNSPIIPERSESFWEDYEKWLKDGRNPHYAKVMFDYSQKHIGLLFSNELVLYQNRRKKYDVINSLALFCRFYDITYDTDFHDQYLRWMKRKELKWRKNSTVNYYDLAKQLTIPQVLQNINNLTKFKDFALFLLVSGLRWSEAIQAWNNHSKLCNDGIIEMFWDRKTKKSNAVYCYFHNIDGIIYHNTVKKYVNSKTLGCQPKYLRKINFTINAMKVDPLLAEFMQGRRGNVSQRHYFLPMMNNYKKKWIRIWGKILNT